MDWWDVLKGRGKIRIPTKRKRLQPPKNKSKVRYHFDAAKSRNAKIDELRAGRQVVGEDGQLRQVTDDEIADTKNAPVAHMRELARKLGEEYRHGGPKAIYSLGGNQRNVNEHEQARRHNANAEREDRTARERAFRQPQVMDHISQDSKARSTNTLPLDMGQPSKFRRRGNLQRRGDESFEPPRRKFVAHDRPGFRTGGGETLPLPDSERERDLRELMGDYVDDFGLYGELWELNAHNRSRADKVNRPQRSPFYMPNEQQISALNERIEFLRNQQYDRAGNRIQQGEQNE